MAMVALDNPIPTRCERCRGNIRVVPCTEMEVPRIAYWLVCLQCGDEPGHLDNQGRYVPRQPVPAVLRCVTKGCQRRPSGHEDQRCGICRDAANGIAQPVEPVKIQRAKSASPVTAKPLAPLKPPKVPVILGPGDAPTCPRGHDRLIYGRRHYESRKKPTWRCAQCRRDREQGYVVPVPEQERRCKNGHLRSEHGFERLERGRTIVRCRACMDVSGKRWSDLRKARAKGKAS